MSYIFKSKKIIFSIICLIIISLFRILKLIEERDFVELFRIVIVAYLGSNALGKFSPRQSKNKEEPIQNGGTNANYRDN